MPRYTYKCSDCEEVFDVVHGMNDEHFTCGFCISRNIGDLTDIIDNYGKHLKKVYELESFYGDETLKFLMDHTHAIRDILKEQYGDVSSITEPIEYQIGEDDHAEEESTEKEEHVFYAGSRRRDS